MKYKKNSRRKRVPSRIWTILFTVLALILIGTVWANIKYTNDLKPVNQDQATQLVTVNSGSSITQIASQLQANQLIRSAWAFDLYVHAHESASDLQAGTYNVSPSQTTPEIVSALSQGKVASKLVTIIPGDRIDQVRTRLINSGFSTSSVDAALNPAQYSGLPVLAFKPANVNTLEGLLWPDSFQKDSTTTPEQIIRESLTEMGQHLTPQVQAEFASEGLSTYQGLTLTSIVLQEVSKPSDQTQVAQVFLSRLKAGMPLGSDVTADYGAIVAGQPPSLSYNSPYNTLINTGLPPTPISTIDSSSLYATTHPANTDWLYFVTGDNGVTYYSTTLATHAAQTAQYCHKLCSQ
ncbi:MAG TPA: endolytic transglycosylase MltG [Candidatus Sulfotelmatobacter sp.]|nr:endolytic transglycosylase MltG [Candidatus Sulfotelmatobacter sp.]